MTTVANLDRHVDRAHEHAADGQWVDAAEALIDLQREAGEVLAEVLQHAHDGGLSWRDIGDQLGISFNTLNRQVRAGRVDLGMYK